MEISGFPALQVEKRKGNEAFHRGGERCPFSVLDFWRWSSSDLLSNATRGIVAEYLVACDLEVTDGVRSEWDPYDLTTRSGTKIEVKSSAYLQSWYQEKLSAIQFSIAPTQAWDPKTGKYEAEKRRQGEVYVFCLLHHKDQATVDPLDVSQWSFFVLATSILDHELGDQRMLSLSRLLSLHPIEAQFGQIGRAVREVVVSRQ